MPPIVAVITLVVGLAASPYSVQPASAATTATLTVDASQTIGTVGTTLSTQLVWPSLMDGVPNGLARLQSLAAPMVRIHAGTDGGYDSVALPLNLPWTIEGQTKPAWDFANLDKMVNDVKSAGTTPVMNVRYAPDPMFTCTNFSDPGTLRDQTYTVFGDYMANLVRYYNTGSVTVPGRTIVNPRGTANRIIWWEIWNEPDYPWENPCVGVNDEPILTPSQYLALWNVTAAKMKAVDASIKLVGPAPSNHPSLLSGTMHDPNDYVPVLLRDANIKPDAISFHGYGGWDNAQSDRQLFDGVGGGGIQAVADGLADIKSWIAQYAPGTQVWLTETNVSAAPGNDSAQRPWNAFSAAWGASMFRRMVLGGLTLIHQYQFLESRQLGLIVPEGLAGAGNPMLPYWRDYYLARYFPTGSTILSSTPSAGAPEVELLAARQPGGGNVRVLIIDRQVNTAAKGVGLPVTVTLQMQNFNGLQSVTMRMLDASTLTQLVNGPPLVAMPTSTTQTVAFTGYGAALLEFSTTTPPPSGAPTPTPTPTGAPTASPTPTPSPSGGATATPTPSSSPTSTPAPTTTPRPPSLSPSGDPTTTLFMPNLTKTLGGPAGWDTPFIVQNVGDGFADVLLSFYRFSDGALIAEHLIPELAPGTSYADIPANNPALPSDTQFSLVVRSFGSRVVAVVNQSQGSGESMQAASYVGTSTGATTVYLPNVTRRFYGYDTPFIVQNLGNATTVVTAAFTSFDGSQRHTIALVVLPGRSGVVDPDFTPGLVDGTQYSVVLRADQPIAAIVNAHNETGAPVAYTTSGITSGARVLYAPYAAKSNNAAGLNSPIVVQNLAGGAVDAMLEFTPLGGGSQQVFTLTAIGAGSSKVFDPRFTLDTTIPCGAASASCLGEGEYSLRVVATGTVAAVVIPTSDVTADAYSATGSPSTRVFIPNVTRTLGGPNGWSTPIILQSGTAMATTATLRWYRFADGGLERTQVLTIPAGGALWVDPRVVAGLRDDSQYSVVVDAGAGATIAAIVYERCYGGGDGVMIYSGLAG